MQTIKIVSHLNSWKWQYIFCDTPFEWNNDMPTKLIKARGVPTMMHIVRASLSFVVRFYLHHTYITYWCLRNLARDPSHKFHSASGNNPTMHHSVTEMCTSVHISVTQWCIVGYGAVSVKRTFRLCVNTWDEIIMRCLQNKHRTMQRPEHISWAKPYKY